MLKRDFQVVPWPYNPCAECALNKRSREILSGIRNEYYNLTSLSYQTYSYPQKPNTSTKQKPASVLTESILFYFWCSLGDNVVSTVQKRIEREIEVIHFAHSMLTVVHRSPDIPTGVIS